MKLEFPPPPPHFSGCREIPDRAAGTGWACTPACYRNQAAYRQMENPVTRGDCRAERIDRLVLIQERLNAVRTKGTRG